jgi:hypothetical protein
MLDGDGSQHQSCLRVLGGCAGFDFLVCSHGLRSFFAPGVQVLFVSSVSNGLQVQQFRGWREGIGTTGYLPGFHRAP